MRTILNRILKKGYGTTSLKKYLLYALGEVVLIVLSLLLALQLNELNQRRQDNSLRESYYELLVKDYESDLEKIQIAQKSFQKELEQINDYGRRLTNPLATNDTLIKIARNEFNPNIPPFVSYTTTALETLKETGDMELLGNDVLQQVNVLQTLQEEQKSYQKITLESHARLLEEYLSDYPLKNGLVNNGGLHETLWSNTDAKKLLLEFNGLLTITRSALMNGTFYYTKIEAETKKSIELLKNKG